MNARVRPVGAMKAMGCPQKTAYACKDMRKNEKTLFAVIMTDSKHATYHATGSSTQ